MATEHNHHETDHHNHDHDNEQNHNGHGHAHAHSHNHNKSARHRLLFMLSLTTAFFFVEISVGYITNSMALVADSFHMLSDVVALIIAYVSVRMSPKKWSKNTFGWARAEVLGALVNAVFLCALCFSILVESIKRFYSPETIHEPSLILVVGFAGLLVNVIGLFLFKDGGGHHHGHSHGHVHAHSDSDSSLDEMDLKAEELYQQSDCPLERSSSPGPNVSLTRAVVTIENGAGQLLTDKNNGKGNIDAKPMTSQQMNMRGVFLHVLADALGSVIVCVSALIIMYTDWQYKDYVDPSLSVLMVCLIMYSTYPLLVESALILLQTVPTHIQVDSLQKKLLQEIDGVLAVHEFHVWQLAGDRIIASAHIRCRNLHDYMQIAEKIKTFFHNKGIHSTTIQPEFVDIQDLESKEEQQHCILDCPTKTICVAQTCCGPQKKKDAGKESPKAGKLNEVSSQNANSSSIGSIQNADQTVVKLIQ